MRARDLAESSLASCRPDIEGGCDSLSDLLREAIAIHIPSSEKARVFAAIDDVLENAGALVSAEDREQIAHGILHAVYGDTRHEPEIRVIAAAALKRFGRDGRSYQAIGDEFGVTRACVHAHSRRIERRTHIKCRSDKDDDARRTSAEKATGRQRSGPRAGGILRGGTGLRGIFGVFKLRGV